MKAFSRLYTELDETTSTNLKIEALVRYFRTAPPENAIWAISFLIGRKPRQVVSTRKLREWAAAAAEIPDWLFEAAYDVVGDLAETISLLLPRNFTVSELALRDWVEEHLIPLRGKDLEDQRKEILSAWQQMDQAQCFVWNKLITGGFRVGVSQKLVIRALAKFSHIEETVIAHRLMGHWNPDPEFYHRLLSANTEDADISRPYPFFLAHPLEDDVDNLGPVNDWQAEWKWDGIRAQIIKRQNEVFIWSRGEELVTDKYPELEEAARKLPNGTVIDGEIIPWAGNGPLNFSELQRRIGRKKVSRKILKEVPVILMAYDLLEFNSEDVRGNALSWRKEALASLIAEASETGIMLSPQVSAKSWEELSLTRDDARSRGVEGLMLKRQVSPYGVGRRRGDWWKWKVDPFTVDAVLIYAQRGHGRRSGLFTDYTFAVWDQNALVPFAKAYSGLTDAEIRQVDRFIQRNTLEKFGPVRSVKPELVFEIAFEDIRKSSRHKSGFAVRFPRISRWRRDKKTAEADTLETIEALLGSQ
ncbi:MAG: ATP-dependent DNA ligase [Deltaproteobacteria bacterium]|nr:MAG: ATP-dependent DNA ligase [Deltaproteobacteria bacterium]